MSRDYEIIKESGIKYKSPETYDHPIIEELKQQLAAERERADIAELAYQGLSKSTVTRGEYDSLLDKHSLLSKAYRAQRDYLNKLEAREQKLREGIEEALRDATKWENPYEGYNDLQKLLASLYPKEETKPAVLEEEEA